ncbi:MAG TPA: hypothetical protein VJH75_02520 [Patescibacteria group bacterium]|nr:hypothetical protein [Patescibacteria group bacterium]
MQIYFKKQLLPDPAKAIRRAGYGEHRDRRSAQISYVKRVHRDWYPRFHVYILEKGEKIIFNMHLDQRATRYEGVTAHSGEYEGEVVKKEAERIKKAVEVFNNPTVKPVQFG